MTHTARNPTKGEEVKETGETMPYSKLRASTRKKPTHPEEDMQEGQVNWFKSQYRKYEDNIIAVPNGGRRNVREAARLKRQGVKAGTPDIFIAIPRLHYSGLWIENKIKPNVLSENQKRMIKVLSDAGYLVKVCYSFDEFKNEIENYLG